MQPIHVIHGQLIQAVDFVMNTDAWVCIRGRECSDDGGLITLKSFLHFPQVEYVPGLVMGSGVQERKFYNNRGILCLPQGQLSSA